jgi:UDP-N-acetylmuramoyl-tripeptide--D-alanyl-D-alanine ligase
MNFIKQSAKRVFQTEARLVIKKYKPKIIAVSGSVGKTTTRDFLYSALSKKFFVRKSEKSIADSLGVMLTVIGRPANEIAFRTEELSFFTLSWQFLATLFFGLELLIWRKKYPDWLILEIDADKPGDIDGVSKWLPIDILVVTAIGTVPSHIETFDSDLEKFLAEKKKLLASLRRDGTIVYNADDETASRLVVENPLKKISCGISGGCDVRGGDFEILVSTSGGVSKPTGMKFEISSGSEKVTATIMDSVGIHNEYAALLSVAVSGLLGVPLSDATKSIEKSALLPGRMKIIAGLKDSTLIDDSYNSSPIAMRQAVEVLGRMQTAGRKIAVVGDMLELGKFSAEEHREVGRLLAPVVNRAICVGFRARRMAEAMLSLSFDENNISCFDNASEAGKFLQNILEPGDIVLIKGSQATRLEKVVQEVMRHPEDKAALLVRQEPEWLGRE